MVASVALVALSTVTAVAMCRVFADWAFLRTLLVMVIGVHAVSILLRIARVPGYIAIPVVVLVIIELLSLLFYRDTMTAFIPSSDTLQLLRLDLRLVWSQFPTAVAPVPSEGSFLLAASVGLGLVAMFADAFAFRAFGRAEAVVPAGVLFIFTAALGTDRHRIGVASAWFAAALVVVAVLRALHGGGTESWLGRRRRAVGAALPATAMCALVAALGAGVVGPLLPGAGAAPLLETRQSQGDLTQVLSPLVDIRSRLTNRRNVELFTVRSSVGRYWRSSGLSVFDGRRWELPESTIESADGPLNAVNATSEIVDQQIEIQGGRDDMVPTAFRPISATGPGMVWLPGTDTLLIADGRLTDGDVFNVVADVAIPSSDTLRAATASNPPSNDFLALPDLPDEIAEQALAVTAGATTPYEKALALQNWFRNEFTYDITVQSGHGDDAILSFLRIRRGYCEQFAGTFGVMARLVGLPSRVAVGYTKGELGADGLYHVYGRQAHAWPEVWFDGVGWVLFEPTPGRGAPGSEGVTGTAESQDTTQPDADTGDNTPPPVTTAPAVTQSTQPRSDEGPGRGTATTVPPVVATTGGGGGSGPTPWLVTVLIIAVAGAWAIAMPSLVRRFTRFGSTPTEQVITSWHGTVGALQLAGAPPPAGATPIEYANLIDHELAIDHRSLGELARFVTRAVYSPAGVGEPAALRAAVLRNHLDESSRGLMPWYTRVLTRVDPRLVRQRLVGERVRVRRRRGPKRSRVPSASSTSQSV
jgi:transglutaminase-like putative cysteine protease